MESASHLQRISCYCAAVGQRMGLDGELIGAASRLHDLGMNGIAQRPAPLTPAERSEVQAHPLTGHAMLAGSGEPAFELAAEIALTHHERFAGDGYPKQLRGEAIPLAGRIVAVADVFDALTTDRVYRPAGTVDQAVHTLKAERGAQLDPRVVDAFLDDLDVAVTVLRRHTPEPAAGALDETVLSLHAAATTLRISPSRLRRWSDEGRIETHRTPGGHRRFPLEAVRRLSEEIGVQPVVRPMDPPGGPVVVLAELLRAHGPKLAAAAAASLYRDGPPGWFASEDAIEVLADWTDTLADGCAQGRYVAAEASSEALMRCAHTHAATLLERHLFLERFAQLTLRLVHQSGADREELNKARRVFSAIQQHLLAVTRPTGFEPVTSRSGGARSIH